MTPFPRMLAGALVAVGLWGPALPAGAQPRDAFLEQRADQCRACYAVVISVSRADGNWLDRPGVPAEAALVGAQLEARGFSVTSLEDPDRIEMIHAVETLFRRRGAEPGARLFLYYGGGTVVRDGAELLAARDTPAGGGGGDAPVGLPLGYLADLMRIARAEQAVTVLDAGLPRAAVTGITGDAPGAPGTPPQLLFAAVAEDGTQAARLPGGLVSVLDPDRREADGDGDGRVSLGEMASALGRLAPGGWLSATPTPGNGGIAAAGDAVTALPVPGDSTPLVMEVPSVDDISLGALAADADWTEAQDRDTPAAYAEFIRRHCSGAAATGDRRCQAAMALLEKARESARVTETECDRLAGDPMDATRTGPGVALEQLDATAAMAACRQALLQNPELPRLLYLYGRALAAAPDGRELQAAFFFREAAKGGNAAALFALGSVFARGIPGVPQNLETAVTLIGRAAEGGYPPAMLAYGKLLARGRFVDKNVGSAIAMLQQITEQLPEAWLEMGLALESQPDDLTALQRALSYYEQGVKANVDGAAQAATALRAKIGRLMPPQESKLDLCMRQLDFDVMEVVRFTDLTSTRVTHQKLIGDRMGRILDRIDAAAAIKACTAAMSDRGVGPDMLTRYALLSNQLSQRGLDYGQGSDEGMEAARRAAEGRDPKGQYLYGIMLLGQASDRGTGAGEAARWLGEAWRSGVDDAGMLLAVMHIVQEWGRQPDFTRRPEFAVDILEQLARKDVPMALFFLGAAKVAPEKLGLPESYRDKTRGLDLLERARNRGWESR